MPADESRAALLLAEERRSGDAAAPLASPVTSAQSRAAARIQRRVRTYLDIKRSQRRNAAVRIQRALRLFAERKRFDRSRAAATKVQQWYRRRRAATLLREAGAPRGPAAARHGSRARTAALIFAWYSFSASLSLFNKHLLGHNRGAFPAPLLMTSVQFFMQWCFSAALLQWPMRALKPQPLPRRAWLRGVLPVGLATGADVGLSNLSLIYVSLSFYVVCKSSTPLFLLAFAFALGLEAPSWRLALSVCTIVAGVACVVAGETAFSGVGFALVMVAAALSGLRWTLTQLLMRGAAAEGNGLSHPLVLLWRVLPVMAAASGFASLALEQPWHRLPNSPYGDTAAHAAATTAMLLLAACLAFGMSMAEFELVHDTSAVTLVVTGTCKEAVIVVLAALIDGDSFGPLNGVGLLLVIAGVGVYNWARHTAAAQRKAAAAAAAVGESGGGGGDGGGGAGVASPPAETHGGGAASPRRAAGPRAGGARLTEAEEGRAVVGPHATAATGLPHHRTRSSSATVPQPQARGSLDEEESYTDVLNALLQNKTR